MPISKLHLMLHGNVRPLREEALAEKSAPPEDRPIHRLRRLFDKTTLLRCVAVTLLSLPVGMVIFRLLSPLLSEELFSAVISSHVPRETAAGLAWLRLYAARLPVLLILAAAGMTRFSGGLTTAVLAFRGVCDGAALALLISSKAGAVAAGVSPVGLTVLFLGWMLVHAAGRTYLAFEARRMARMPVREDLWSSSLPEDERKQLRYRLWRYFAVILSVACVSLAACGVYAALLARI